MKQSFPLDWPLGYPRTKSPKRSRFNNPTLARSVNNIIDEIKRLVGRCKFHSADVVISSNVPLRNDGLPRADYMRSRIDDRGVAVYFKRGKQDIVICCDEWDTVESNMHAIFKTIEAMRAIERWGVSDFIERSFTGFQALPENNPEHQRQPWWMVLNYTLPPGKSPWDWEGVKAQYKSLSKKYHPDSGGTHEKMTELNAAFDQAKQYFNL